MAGSQRIVYGVSMDIEDALGRLRDFRKSWNDVDMVCDDSQLTAADLDLLIDWMTSTLAGPQGYHPTL